MKHSLLSGIVDDSKKKALTNLIVSKVNYPLLNFINISIFYQI